MRAKLDLLTLLPKLLVGRRGSMMFRNLVWKALGVVLVDSGEKPGGLYMCRMSAMKSSFSSGRSFMSGKGRAASKGTLLRPSCLVLKKNKSGWYLQQAVTESARRCTKAKTSVKVHTLVY